MHVGVERGQVERSVCMCVCMCVSDGVCVEGVKYQGANSIEWFKGHATIKTVLL